MTNRDGAPQGRIASRIAVRRGEFVQLRRRLLSASWVWYAAFIVLGTLLVAPTRSREVPRYGAGDIAANDVVVEREVVLPDQQSTEDARHRASLEVLPVYALDPSVETAVAEKLRRTFDEGRKQSGGSGAELASRLGEAGGLVVQAREAEVLRAARFSDDVLSVLLEAARRLYAQGIVADRSELLHSAERGVILREPGKGEERVELDVYRFLDSGPRLSEAVEQRLAGDAALARAWRPALASFLARTLVPNILFDRGETLTRRLRAAASVEEVSVRLPRGKVVVRRGDEVTPQAANLLAALAERNSSSQTLLPVAGVLLLATLLAGTWRGFVRRQTASRDEARSRFGGLVIVTLLSLGLERAFAFLVAGLASAAREPFASVDLYLPALPHGTGPIVAGLMFGLPTAILFAVIQAILVALMIGSRAPFAVYVLLSGVAAAFASLRLRERYVLARAGAIIAAVNTIAVIALAFWSGRLPTGAVLAFEIGAGVTGGVIAAALASFLLPVLESLTGTVTDIRLLELSNPNLPLLKRLSLEAPGTFQHSLAMANLAESAAEAIGANPLLARVCCYYHDIGKLAKPEYFVENQRGDNPHDNLTPWMSALVVSNHVKAGLELARTYRLPEPIRDAITTHHGTKLIRYFYSRAKERESPDRGEVQETEFRYPGPRPRSKEMGILLLADAVEAAGRTLQEATPGRIQSMIDQVIKNVLEEGQLDECELTLKDIDKVGAAFFWVLTNVFHHRIDYPGFDFNRKRRG